MKQQMQTTTQGFSYFLNGLRRLPEPGIRAFVVIPLMVNVLVFSLLIWLATRQFSGWVDSMVNWLPDWLSFLGFIVWPLFAASIMPGPPPVTTT